MSVLATPGSIAGAQVDDALGEQVRVHVHDPLPARMLGDHVRDRVRAHDGHPLQPDPARPGRHDLAERVHDPVDEPVLAGLGGGVPVVVQRVVEDPRHRLAGVLGDEPEHGVDRVPQVVGLDLDVDGAAADPGRAPVHQDARVRQREPLAPGPGREQELPGAAGQPQRQGGDVARHQPHDVADGEHGRHRAAGGVDPQRDVGDGVLGGQREQLRHQQRAVVVVEHPVEHQHPAQQQLLPGPLAELRNLVFVSHDPSLRHGSRPARARCPRQICPQQIRPPGRRGWHGAADAVRYSAVPWPRAYAG